LEPNSLRRHKIVRTSLVSCDGHLASGAVGAGCPAPPTWKQTASPFILAYLSHFRGLYVVGLSGHPGAPRPQSGPGWPEDVRPPLQGENRLTTETTESIAPVLGVAPPPRLSIRKRFQAAPCGPLFGCGNTYGLFSFLPCSKCCGCGADLPLCSPV